MNGVCFNEKDNYHCCAVGDCKDLNTVNLYGRKVCAAHYQLVQSNAMNLTERCWRGHVWDCGYRSSNLSCPSCANLNRYSNCDSDSWQYSD